MILGHGVDLVEVGRVARSIDRHGDRFLERVFTEAEREYAGDGRRRDEHLAARFAAKEAVFKALGTGWAQGAGWTDIEVVRNASGRPSVVLHDRASELAARMGVKWWHLSLTHTGELAMASVIAEG
ncbi:MAG: holo-ACP synthase [Phycisphaerales bacterium]|nr:holo-ACP synthase [Phycisphaerales bacterium]